MVKRSNHWRYLGRTSIATAILLATILTLDQTTAMAAHERVAADYDPPHGRWACAELGNNARTLSVEAIPPQGAVMSAAVPVRLEIPVAYMLFHQRVPPGKSFMLPKQGVGSVRSTVTLMSDWKTLCPLDTKELRATTQYELDLVLRFPGGTSPAEMWATLQEVLIEPTKTEHGLTEWRFRPDYPHPVIKANPDATVLYAAGDASTADRFFICPTQRPVGKPCLARYEHPMGINIGLLVPRDLLHRARELQAATEKLLLSFLAE